MTTYGGLGGIKGVRPRNTADEFENALDRALGDKMRTSRSLCKEVWCALANIDWTHMNGDTAGYSFRAAGDVVAAVSGIGEYMTWYCSGPDGIVSDEIAQAMAAEGWTWEELV